MLFLRRSVEAPFAAGEIITGEYTYDESSSHMRRLERLNERRCAASNASINAVADANADSDGHEYSILCENEGAFDGIPGLETLDCEAVIVDTVDEVELDCRKPIWRSPPRT